MMRDLLLIVIISAFFFNFSLGQHSPDVKNNCPEALKRFTDRLLHISMGFLKSYSDSTPGETGTVSAYAALTIAGTLGLFAEGVTKNEIYTTIDVKSRDEVVCIAEVTHYPVYRLPPCAELGVAKDIFGNINYQFTPDFINNVTKIIIGVAKNFYFSNCYQTVDAINALVANLTYNRIPNIIEDSSIFNSCTQLVSVSGWSFKANWEIKFQRPSEEILFRISQTESAPQAFLYQDGVYNYSHSEILGAEVVQINFCCGSNFYLWIILPDCPFTEGALIDKMSQNIDWYYELKQVMKPTRLDLYIVKYEKTTMVDSKALLIDTTNITSIYNNDTIDLKGAIECDIPAAISAGGRCQMDLKGLTSPTIPTSL